MGYGVWSMEYGVRREECEDWYVRIGIQLGLSKELLLIKQGFPTD